MRNPTKKQVAGDQELAERIFDLITAFDRPPDVSFHLFSWLVCYLHDCGMSADELADHLRRFIADHDSEVTKREAETGEDTP
jgi:hypothetical protein